MEMATTCAAVAVLLLAVFPYRLHGHSWVSRFIKHQYDVQSLPDLGQLQMIFNDFGLDPEQSLLLIKIEQIDGLEHNDHQVNLQLGEDVFKISGSDSGSKHLAFFPLDTDAREGQHVFATVLHHRSDDARTPIEILGQTSARVKHLMKTPRRSDWSQFHMEIPLADKFLASGLRNVVLRGTKRHLTSAQIRRAFWKRLLVNTEIGPQDPVSILKHLANQIGGEFGGKVETSDNDDVLFDDIGRHFKARSEPISSTGIAEFLNEHADPELVAEAMTRPDCHFISGCNAGRFTGEDSATEWQKLFNPFLQCAICEHTEAGQYQFPTILDAAQPEAQLGSSPLETFLSLVHEPTGHVRVKRKSHPEVKVLDRKTGQESVETIAGYIRHALDIFFGPTVSAGDTALGRKAMKVATDHMGSTYSKTKEKTKNKQIKKFLGEFPNDLKMSDFKESDAFKYPTMNAFFAREIKPEVRPIEADPNEAVCAADSRLMAFPVVEEANKFWIKGKDWTLKGMLDNDETLHKALEGGSMAIFRLAPQDYHRFHSPVDGTVESIKHVKGALFSVNPLCINSNVNVFGVNKRTIAHIKSPQFGDVAFIMVSAMMVGTLKLTGLKDAEPFVKHEVKKGQELGYFEFGGSTVIAVFPKGKIKFSDDLEKNSQEKKLETVVFMGTKLGKAEAYHAAGAPHKHNN